MKRKRLVAAGLAFSWLAALPLAAQAPKLELVTTIETGADLAVLATWSVDGKHLAYATEKKLRERKISVKEQEETYTYPGEVWVSDLAAKPRRVFRHERFRDWVGNVPSYYVTRLSWAPDAQKLAVEINDEQGESVVFLTTAEGKPIKLRDVGAYFVSGYGAGWLADNESLALLREASSPRLLQKIFLLRVGSGRSLSLYREMTFAAVAWLPRARQAVLVARDREFSEPARLLLGDLEAGTTEELAELGDDYLGGLEATPEENRVSYFVGQNKLAVRALTPGSTAELWPIPFGRYEWAGSASAVLFLEPQEKGRRLGWLTLYDRAQDKNFRLLPEVLLYDFWVSPDGQRLAVLTAGENPELRIYQLTLPAAH